MVEEKENTTTDLIVLLIGSLQTHLQEIRIKGLYKVITIIVFNRKNANFLDYQKKYKHKAKEAQTTC